MREVKVTFLSLLAIVSVPLAGACWWQTRSLREQSRGTEGAIATLRNMAELCDRIGKVGLSATNANGVAESLRQVTPWASTPPWGPPPDARSTAAIKDAYAILERVRLHNQYLLIQRLRQLTAEDLGDDSKPWLQKYAKPDSSRPVL